MFAIKVGSFPGEIREILIESGTTVRETLNIANVPFEGCLVQMDGTEVDLNAIASGALLIVTKKLKSGR